MKVHCLKVRLGVARPRSNLERLGVERAMSQVDAVVNRLERLHGFIAAKVTVR